MAHYRLCWPTKQGKLIAILSHFTFCIHHQGVGHETTLMKWKCPTMYVGQEVWPFHFCCSSAERRGRCLCTEWCKKWYGVVYYCRVGKAEAHSRALDLTREQTIQNSVNWREDVAVGFSADSLRVVLRTGPNNFDSHGLCTSNTATVTIPTSLLVFMETLL